MFVVFHGKQRGGKYYIYNNLFFLSSLPPSRCSRLYIGQLLFIRFMQPSAWQLLPLPLPPNGHLNFISRFSFFIFNPQFQMIHKCRFRHSSPLRFEPLRRTCQNPRPFLFRNMFRNNRKNHTFLIPGANCKTSRAPYTFSFRIDYKNIPLYGIFGTH